MHKPESSNIRIIAVGRLVTAKDWPTLLRAWAQVSGDLEIVGDGELLPSLHALAGRLGVEDRVRFLGHREDVENLLLEADLVVSASKREGFSYVILEALHAQCVVVSTPTGVAPQLLSSDYLFPVGDPDACARCVRSVQSSLPQARLAFKSAWHEAQSLTVQRMARETETVYADVLSRDRGRPPRD